MTRRSYAQEDTYGSAQEDTQGLDMGTPSLRSGRHVWVAQEDTQELRSGRHAGHMGSPSLRSGRHYGSLRTRLRPYGDLRQLRSPKINLIQDNPDLFL